MDLFTNSFSQVTNGPLADRLRPTTFSDFFGQEQIFTQNKFLVDRLREGQLQSLILWGPPGSGKTSFAKAITQHAKAHVVEENAIDLGAKKIRDIGGSGKSRLFELQQKTILFIDEIHRLNKGQQDVLLPFVEKGYFYLVGATTENPSYQLNAALLSRCRLVVFEPLKSEALAQLADKALSHSGIKRQDFLAPAAFTHLIHASHGDARQLLNAIEELLQRPAPSPATPMTLTEMEEVFKSSGLRFDKQSDEHYDTISAFIKSIRGSSPDAGIYYLARMLLGGEDPLFIARRLVILASEDIGNADPQALSVAVNCLKAVELVGLPEAEINLAQAVTYLASAPKSNSSYIAIKKAKRLVAQTGPLPIPKSLRSAATPAMKQLGYGEGYNYAHDGDKGWQPQDFLPESVQQEKFYEPANRGFEKRIKEYLEWMKK